MPFRKQRSRQVNNASLVRPMPFELLGVFNVSILVSNEYGRSSVDSTLFRMSGAGQLHNFETYAGQSLFTVHQFDNFVLLCSADQYLVQQWQRGRRHDLEHRRKLLQSEHSESIDRQCGWRPMHDSHCQSDFDSMPNIHYTDLDSKLLSRYGDRTKEVDCLNIFCRWSWSSHLSRAWFHRCGMWNALFLI